MDIRKNGLSFAGHRNVFIAYGFLLCILQAQFQTVVFVTVRHAGQENRFRLQGNAFDCSRGAVKPKHRIPGSQRRRKHHREKNDNAAQKCLQILFHRKTLLVSPGNSYRPLS